MRAAIASPEWSAHRELDGLAKDFVRWAIALTVTGGDGLNARQVFASRWPNAKSVELLHKAAVQPGETTGDTWGDALAPLRPMANAYLAMLRPRTVLGRLTGLRQAPINVAFPRQTANCAVGWTHQGSPIQASALGFDQITLPPAKIAGLVVISKELARSSDPAAERLIEQDLTSTVAAFMDRQFLDPSVAAVADLTPASVTYGGVSVAASGTTAAAFKIDVRNLVEQMTAQGGVFANLAWVMTPRMALSLALMGLDPALGMTGGTLFGVPVLTTVDAPSSGDSPDSEIICLLDSSGLAVADGGLNLTASGQGDVEMSTTPDSPATASTVMVSLWQRNLVGLMATRHVNYARLNAGSAGCITGCNYGA